MDRNLNGHHDLSLNDHVVVIGGGISGLAAAHRLLRVASGARVTLLEADNRLGGKIVTHNVDGFLIEGGADSFLASKPRGVGLCAEIGLGDHLQGVTPRRRRAFVLSHGHLHDLPEGLSGLAPTRLMPIARSSLLSPLGKARVALEFVLPRRHGEEDESLGGFMRRRLGSEAWERLIEPLMAGIYAADGDALSLAATFPQLRDAERVHGGVIKGALAARPRAQASGMAPRSPFLTPIGGIGELVTTLAITLTSGGVTICMGTPVTAVDVVPGGYVVRLASGNTVLANAVVVATPAFAAAQMLDAIDGGLVTDLAAIAYVSTAIVTFAFRRDQISHPLDAHGYVVPRIEGGPILACTWPSRKWAGRAPEGWELIRVFIGRSGRESDLAGDDESLFALARREVVDRLGTTASPTRQRIDRWPRGMPQYLLGHPERVARIELAVRGHRGLFLAGSAYHGVGIPDCIASGEAAADAVGATIAMRGA
ncbi:MAG: protoporphyrinogen oxidase [Chloroflexota bacterium]|nr:protoporphyrinogen oxidase [Chloroflexota bacterium]